MYDSKIFEKFKIEYNWGTLIEGLKLGCLNLRSVSDFAESFTLRNPSILSTNLDELLWEKTNNDEVITLITKLLDEIHYSYNQQDEIRKWRYCLLKEMVRTTEDKILLLENVAQVYSDFDYPEEMENFIYYMEPKDDYDPTAHNKDENMDRLISNLVEFLGSEERYLHNLYNLQQSGLEK